MFTGAKDLRTLTWGPGNQSKYLTVFKKKKKLSYGWECEIYGQHMDLNTALAYGALLKLTFL